MSERPLIEWLRQRIRPAPHVPVGPGDDAAVLLLATVPEPQCLAAGPQKIVVTADAFLEGTHFLPNDEPARIGHKVIAASVSDIAAMGCYPLASFVTVGINKTSNDKFVHELAEAMIAAAEKYEAPVAGGDVTAWAGPLAVSVTVVGETRGLSPVLRSGASAGDRIFVTGSLGGALLGRHLEAPPRIREGIFLNREAGATAMIDISDGLSTDLCHIAEESHSGALIRAEAIPVSEAARELEGRDGVAALRHALDDGEDFELLFTIPPKRAARLREAWPFDLALAEIGEVGGTDVFIECADGARERLEPHGYEHGWGRDRM